MGKKIHFGLWAAGSPYERQYHLDKKYPDSTNSSAPPETGYRAQGGLSLKFETKKAGALNLRLGAGAQGFYYPPQPRMIEDAHFGSPVRACVDQCSDAENAVFTNVGQHLDYQRAVEGAQWNGFATFGFGWSPPSTDKLKELSRLSLSTYFKFGFSKGKATQDTLIGYILYEDFVAISDDVPHDSEGEWLTAPIGPEYPLIRPVLGVGGEFNVNLFQDQIGPNLGLGFELSLGLFAEANHTLKRTGTPSQYVLDSLENPGVLLSDFNQYENISVGIPEASSFWTLLWGLQLTSHFQFKKRKASL